MGLSRRVCVISCLLALALPLGAQDWKGRGRLAGKVTDTEGNPLQGVEVKLDNPDRGGGPVAKTDKKGRWAVLGVVAGNWNIDFNAEGYLPKAIRMNLPSESTRLPPIEVELEAPQGPSPDVLDALDGAEAAFTEGRYAEARAEFERLLTELPEHATTIRQRIGLCYVREHEYEKAMEEFDFVLAAEPENHQIRAIAALAALEGKLLDQGRQYLADLDEGAIDHPDMLYNIGVNFLNAAATEEALLWFSKTIERDPAYVDAYYRRALGHLGLGQNAEARADFEKVLELQPEGIMADNARKVLEQTQ